MRPPAQRTWWAPALRADYVVMHVSELCGEYNVAKETTDISVEFTKLNCRFHICIALVIRCDTYVTPM